MVKHKARLLQGGFAWRKAAGWFCQLMRFKGRIALGVALCVCPFYPELNRFKQKFVVGPYLWYYRLFRPTGSLMPNYDIRSPTIYNTKPFFPPQLDLSQMQHDWQDIAEADFRLRQQLEYRIATHVNLVRNLGFAHHPSRETSALVEGAIFREEQNQLIDNLRFNLARELVSRGVWSSVEEAYSAGVRLRRSPRPFN